MSTKDLQEKIEKIAAQLIEKYKPVKVILFGSAARGDFTGDSDIDFLIIKANVPHYGTDRMRELDRLIERDVAVDMIVYRPDEFERLLQLGDPFIKSVLKEGRVLHG